jgi:hypothetical protein
LPETGFPGVVGGPAVAFVPAVAGVLLFLAFLLLLASFLMLSYLLIPVFLFYLVSLQTVLYNETFKIIGLWDYGYIGLLLEFWNINIGLVNARNYRKSDQGLDISNYRNWDFRKSVRCPALHLQGLKNNILNLCGSQSRCMG